MAALVIEEPEIVEGLAKQIRIQRNIQAPEPVNRNISASIPFDPRFNPEMKDRTAEVLFLGGSPLYINRTLTQTWHDTVVVFTPELPLTNRPSALHSARQYLAYNLGYTRAAFAHGFLYLLEQEDLRHHIQLITVTEQIPVEFLSCINYTGEHQNGFRYTPDGTRFSQISIPTRWLNEGNNPQLRPLLRKIANGYDPTIENNWHKRVEQFQEF